MWKLFNYIFWWLRWSRWTGWVVTIDGGFEMGVKCPKRWRRRSKAVGWLREQRDKWHRFGTVRGVLIDEWRRTVNEGERPEEWMTKIWEDVHEVPAPPKFIVADKKKGRADLTVIRKEDDGEGVCESCQSCNTCQIDVGRNWTTCDYPDDGGGSWGHG